MGRALVCLAGTLYRAARWLCPGRAEGGRASPPDWVCWATCLPTPPGCEYWVASAVLLRVATSSTRLACVTPRLTRVLSLVLRRSSLRSTSLRSSLSQDKRHTTVVWGVVPGISVPSEEHRCITLDN
eukprot:scaffold12992_cov58-Phaeocystis_antarctica.AAC.1